MADEEGGQARRRERLRDAPAGPVGYRLVETSSEDWLEGLRRRAYADLFEATWGGWDEARHRRHFAKCMERGHVSVIEVDGMPVGMIQLAREGDAVEILEIQIDPRHQNRGIGTSVLRDVIADASAEGSDVRLSVGLENGKAIRLYERLGFVSVGQSDTHRHMLRQAAG